MSSTRFRFELAGPADEADLRHVLAQTPMDGTIRVAFGREPDYFAGAVEGRLIQVVACRDLESGRIIGFGTRSVLDRYVNGERMPIGYLGGLRVLEEYRNQGLVARGFAFFRQRHREDGRTPLYLTTIAEGNEVALQTLTTHRAGLPRYHPAGKLHTLALAPSPPWRRAEAKGLALRPAEMADVPAILDLLSSQKERRQFLPCYEEGDLFTSGGLLRGLRPEDVWLAWQGGRLMVVLGVWDQHAYKQSVVVGYAPFLTWLRPVYNAWARLTGDVVLPPAGRHLRYRTAALPVVHEGDPGVFLALLAAARSSLGEEAAYLMLGLHEDDPLWPLAARLGGRRYTTLLYLVCWDDGETLRQGLNGRPPYLELGCL